MLGTRCQKIRREGAVYAATSGWVTSNVPGLLAWYRVRDPSNTISGGALATANDASGNGFHITQGTGTKRPTVNTADSYFGGVDSASHDGADDFLQYASGFGAQTYLTFFLVTRSYSATASSQLVSLGNTVQNQSMRVVCATAGDGRITAVYANPAGTLTTRRSEGTSGGEVAYSTTTKPLISVLSFDSTAAAASAWATRSRLAERITVNIASNATQAQTGALAFSVGSQANGSATTCAAFTWSEIIISNAAPSSLTTDVKSQIEMYLAAANGVT